MNHRSPCTSWMLMIIPLLVACGGGGGGSQDPVPAATPSAAPAGSASMTAVFSQPSAAQTGLAHAWGIQSDSTLTDAEYFAGGMAAGDYDLDGDIDLYVAFGNLEPSKLYRNNGDLTFTDVALTAGVQLTQRSSGSTFVDIDGDGWLDLFVGAIEGDAVHLFQNNRDGTFTDQTASSGLNLAAPNTISAAFGDIDLDGDLDMALSHWGHTPQTDTEHLWRHQGGMSFESWSIPSTVSQSIIVLDNPAPVFADLDYTFTPTFADLNNDRYPDLLYVADFITSQVFLNLRDGRFENITTEVIKDENGMGSAVADYDNDGDLDWFVSSIYNREPNQGIVFKLGNRLYTNDGTGQFEDRTVEQKIDNGGWGWASCFADVNNDGHLDLFHTNGWRDGEDPANDYTIDQSRLFLSDRQGGFLQRSDVAGITDTGQGRGVVCFDADRDGDIDLLISSHDEQGLLLYRNDSNNGNHFMLIKLAGTPPNTEAVGARIYLTTPGVTQMREIHVGSNFTSQNPAEAHFGLGLADQAQQIRVLWPDGTESTLDNIAADQFLVITQPD